MRVVLDTTILKSGGYQLRGDKWPLILIASQSGHVRLCVPEVVVRERVAQYRRCRDKAFSCIKDVNRQLRSLGLAPVVVADGGDGEMEDEVVMYETWLRSTIQKGGEILPVPDVDHGVLLNRLFARRKPFSVVEKGEKGYGDAKGYRDALIWYSTVEAAKAGRVTFVTNDGDFRDSDELALHLIADLDLAGVPIGHVRLLRDFESIIDEQFPEDTEASEMFLTLVESAAGKRRFEELTHALLVDNFLPLEAKPMVMPETVFDRSFHVEGDIVPRISSASARPVGGGEFIVIGKVEVVGLISGLTWRPGLLGEHWMEEVFGVAEPWCVSYDLPQQISMEFSLRFRVPDQLIEELDLGHGFLEGLHGRE